MADKKKKPAVSIDKDTYDALRKLSRLLGVSVPKLLAEATTLLLKRYERMIRLQKAAADGK
jgi:phage terminase small subunit